MFKPEHVEQTKKYLNSAAKTGLTVAKYGLTFTSGVLVGTVVGVVLFFKIGGDPI